MNRTDTTQTVSGAGRLEGKVALITGAASGFGAAIARRFAGEGARVLLADLNAEAGADLAATLGGRFARCDVSRGDEVRAAVALALSAFGRIDIVVNNAGTTFPAKPAHDLTEAELDTLYNVNVKSLYHMHCHAAPSMVAQRSGVFVNVASVTGVRPGRGLTWYGGTKAAMIGISKGLAAELAPHGVRVCVVNPMLGDTPLLGRFMGTEDTPAAREKFIARVPLGRLARPADVANAVLFLASDEAEYVTGVALDVDGGRNNL